MRSVEIELSTSPQAWPALSCQRATAAAYVSDDEESVCSAISAISDLSSAASAAATTTRSRSSSFSSVSSSSTTASCWWHTRADTDDYDDNISCRTAFQWSALGINLAYAACTPVVSEEVDDESDGLFADVVPNLLALVDDSAEAPPVAIKAAPVAVKAVPVAAIVTDDDASEDDASEDEEVKARAVRRARHDKRRVRNLRKLVFRAARAAQNAAAAVDFDAALNEFTV